MITIFRPRPYLWVCAQDVQAGTSAVEHLAAEGNERRAAIAAAQERLEALRQLLGSFAIDGSRDQGRAATQHLSDALAACR